MASSTLSLTRLLNRLSLTTPTTSTLLRATTTTTTMTTTTMTTTTTTTTRPPIIPTRRTISTSPTLSAKPAAKSSSSSSSSAASKPKRKHNAPRSENYLRIRNLKRNLFSPAPPPLRMARLRHLRHWTIHRAWMLFRRQQRDAISKERSRMHFGMYNACEELRRTVGPGSRDEGYLYRVAMEKKGVYGLHGVPIEYARFQTENPPREAWNHEWKR